MDNTDNNVNPAGFLQIMNHPTFVHLFRSLSRVNFNDSEDDTQDMPPLEPITTAENNQPAGQNVDSIIPPALQPLSENAASNTAGGDDDNDDHSDNDEASMPDLQSISGSSDDSESSLDDADEVEMMQDLQAVDDDNDSSWTDDDMPALENMQPPSSQASQHSQTPRTNRRARVDDDEDQERDRRHPSQRIAGTTDSNDIDQRPPPSPVLHFHIPTFVRIVSGPGPAPPVRILQNIIAASTAPAPNQTAPAPNTNNQPPPAFPIFTGGFTVAFGAGPDNARAGPPAHDHVHNGPPPFGTAPAGFRTDGIDLNMFAELVGRFGPGIAQVFAMGMEREEQEDPERAQRLVDGLEEVPLGLVKRLERVGGAPGGHVDGDQASSPGCAICWDRLLDAEGDAFTSKAGTNAAGAEDVTTQSSDLPESTTPPDPSATSSTPSTSAPTPSNESRPQPKIVSLPCAHVFHASCLLPWFSRPNQTTCPTCRFNIDPENLTYVARPIPQTQTNVGLPTQDAAAGGVTPNAGDNTDPTPVAPLAVPNNFEINVPQPFIPPQNAPINQAAPAVTPTPPPAPAPDANVRNANQAGGFWTFGFDVVIEHGQETGEGGDQNMAPGEADRPDIDIAMNMDERDEVDPTGEMRREAEAFAEQLLGSMGFNVNTAAADDQPRTTPFAMGNAAVPPFGAQIGNLPPGVTRIFTAPGQNIPLPQDIPTFMPPGTDPLGAPAPAGSPPPRANVNPLNPWGNFAQMFGGTGMNVPPGTLPGADIPFPFPTPFRRTAPREKKPWSLPSAPGATLRQRVEQKEREAGLRCYDVSCGVGPSDEEPCTDICDAAMKQLRICPLRNDPSAGVKSSMCLHTFHPACLVSAERVALQGAEETFIGDEVPVSCPVCRAVGSISSEDWREGAQALA